MSQGFAIEKDGVRVVDRRFPRGATRLDEAVMQRELDAHFDPQMGIGYQVHVFEDGTIGVRQVTNPLERPGWEREEWWRD